MTTSTILALSALLFVFAAIAVLICSAHIPVLRVLTNAAPLEAEEKAVPVLPPLPLDDNPEGFAADTDRTYRTTQQARRDYENSLHAGYVESLAAYSIRRDLLDHIPARTRKETP